MVLPKVKAVLFSGKTYSNGAHPIMIRITHDRKHTYKATGFSIHPDAWDVENCLVYEKKPVITKRQEGQLKAEKLAELKERYKRAVVLSNAAHVNAEINNLIQDINAVNKKLEVNEQSLDVRSIRRVISPSKGLNTTEHFFEYAGDIRERFLKAGKIGTYKRYKTCLLKLQSYAKRKDLKFVDIDATFLAKYENHLQSKSYKPNTIYNNMKVIRAVFYKAMKEGICSPEKNPFLLFKLKMDTRTNKQKLTIKEILAIEELKLDEGSLVWHVRNCFLFSFYCAGIRISDLLQLKWKNLTRNGRLEYQMEKTGSFKSLVLLPKAIKILGGYRDKTIKPTDYIFSLIPNDIDSENPMVIYNQISAKTAMVNKYLKKIATLAGIDKPLTTHIARHSFSDIARQRKASIYDISKMLGHSSIKITENYLASLDLDSQDETLKNIMDF